MIEKKKWKFFELSVMKSIMILSLSRKLCSYDYKALLYIMKTSKKQGSDYDIMHNVK